MSALAPPKITTEDPGAHELTDSDEHFSDASEGHKAAQAPPHSPGSPIPTTRVERVDDQPTYGEVPGTPAYSVRAQDAVPDEIEIVPEGKRSRSHSHLSQDDRPSTPGGTPIPKTVVEKVDPDRPSHGDVPGTAAHEMRLADAEPDVILKAPEMASRPVGDRSEDTAAVVGPPANEHDYDEGGGDEDDGLGDAAQNTGADDGGFGDDFDDFEEGGGGAEDDFGDFDDGFQEADPSSSHEAPFVQPSVPTSTPYPPIDLSQLQTPEEIQDAIRPYLSAIFPDYDDVQQPTNAEVPPKPLLTDRSLSLMTQLVAPPPLQPPNWIRSRTRRLFLVSLGVPVDLDEILPASKQKKLILPSLENGGGGGGGGVSRLKRDEGASANASSTSLNSTDSKGGSRRERR
ncbi:hypothetical protein LTR66_017380, partial [Elasticomyces elasticus]